MLAARPRAIYGAATRICGTAGTVPAGRVVTVSYRRRAARRPGV